MQQSVGERMFRECRAMLQNALADGKTVPGSVLSTIGAFEAIGEPSEGEDGTAPPAPPPSLERLGHAHQVLSKLVAPALPGTLKTFASSWASCSKRCWEWRFRASRRRQPAPMDE